MRRSLRWPWIGRRKSPVLRTTHGQGISELKEKISKMTVTTGCGQGTIFSCTLDKILELRLPPLTVRQSHLYGLMKAGFSK